jgi:CheY-like chemotaxis protein
VEKYMIKKKVLIADDDAEMRKEVSEILKSEGYLVKTAGDGRSVMKQLEKTKFDVLLLDLKMPLMSGYEVLVEMQKKKIKLRTIVLTGNILGSGLPEKDGMNSAEKAGILKLADSVMNKPFDIVKLIEKISVYACQK